MKRILDSRLFRFTGLILGALVWLANNGNPPNGRTGAPFDGHCANCHGGSNPGGFNGDVSIDGISGNVEANTVYPMTITLTPTAGSPVRGGFQLVVVDGNNANCGNLAAANGQSGTEFFGGREYLDHRSAKNFTGGGPVTWNFTWTSPVSMTNNTVRFYFIGNFTNGNNNDSGDFAIAELAGYTFSGPPPVIATMGEVNQVSCFGGNDGSATVEATGGVAPYSYLWSNSQTTQTAVNLAAGNYTVTVTGSGGSGSSTASVTIIQSPNITVTTGVGGAITCLQPEVTATATASGGTPPYLFEWSNAETGPNAAISAPGTYSVVVTDSKGCTKSASVNVTSNINLPIAEAGAGASLSCAQPTVGLSGAGSTTGANISYQWTTSDGNIVSGANTLSPLVNAAGTYVLTVQNTANGCSATDETQVTSNITPPTVSATGGQLTCAQASLQLLGATNAPQANFLWTGPNGYSSTVQNPTISQPGTYTLRVTNTANSCTATATATVTQNVAPPTVSANVSGTLTCTTTSLNLAGSSTAGVYNWTGPNDFTSSLQNPSVSQPGNYILTSMGSNGCSAADTVTVGQNIAPPGATASAGGSITCAAASVTLSGASPAVNPLFAWTGPNGFTSTQQNPVVQVSGDYILTVTSTQNGCASTASATVGTNTTPPTANAGNSVTLTCAAPTAQLNGTASSQGASFAYLWSTVNGNLLSGATTLTPVVGAPGTYSLLVTNTANGCSAASSVTVAQNPALTATILSATPVSCNGGSNGAASVQASGGNGVYTYVWSTGATTASLSGVPAGAYSVVVSEGGGCTSTASVTINQPAALAANAAATAETAAGANNGTATATPAGGTPPYTYAWSNNAATAAISGLSPGNYTVSVSDANACTTVQTVTVNSFNCTLSAGISATPVTCNGAANGTATVSVSGAAQPVAYLWSTNATTASVDNLAAGNYTVQITDANNCPAQLSVSISEPPALLVNATATGETAAGAQNGTAVATPTGGVAPYTFAWSTSETSPSVSGLSPGAYSVVVTDANLCTASQTVIINAFNCSLLADISLSPVSCAGASDGQATLTLTGGQLPFTYTWSNGDTTATADGLSAGTYTVSVSDANGCLLNSSTTITEPVPLTLSIAGITPVTCAEDQTGAIELAASGGTLPYQTQWSVGSTGQNLGPGNYSATLTDANGCSAVQTATIAVTDSEAPVLQCASATLVGCPGQAVVYAAPSASDNCNLNGALPVLVSGLPSGSVFPVGTTVQTFRIADASGNTATCSFSVAVEANPAVSVTEVVDDSNGSGSGSISIAVEGGVSAQFSWEKDGAVFATTEDLSGLGAGTYTLTVIFANGCSVTLDPVIVNNTVSASEPGKSATIRLIPNPAKTYFRLEAEGWRPTLAQLYDARGALLEVIRGDELSAEISVSVLPEGLYYLVVGDENGVRRVLKFVKSSAGE